MRIDDAEKYLGGNLVIVTFVFVPFATATRRRAIAQRRFEEKSSRFSIIGAEKISP
jgi:hypothetical protein